ncbi:IS3-Spn1 transposase [Streptococcus pneumoniae]|nr:IS3-Spn1 transposase [Streptococcus pneumoniae]
MVELEQKMINIESVTRVLDIVITFIRVIQGLLIVLSSQAIVDYIDYYNNKRIKVKLKGLSPVQYRTKSFG